MIYFSPAPAKPPGDVRGHNVSSTAIRVEWDIVPPEDQNGIILGYRVNYSANGIDRSKEVLDGLGTRLEKLVKFTKYNICVYAFNIKGHGPPKCISVTSAEDGM